MDAGGEGMRMRIPVHEWSGVMWIVGRWALPVSGSFFFSFLFQYFFFLDFIAQFFFFSDSNRGFRCSETRHLFSSFGSGSKERWGRENVVTQRLHSQKTISWR